MKNLMNSGRWVVLLVALTLIACGEPSAEDAARKIAEKECECKNEYRNQRGAVEQQVTEKLLAEAKTGKFKTQSAISERREILEGELGKQVNGDLPCQDEIK